MPAEDLDLLTASTEVDERRIGTGAVVGALLLGVAVLTLVVVVIVGMLGTVKPAERTPEERDGLALAELQALTGVPFPAGTEIVASQYSEDAEAIIVTAEVALPEGADNPFLDSPYYAIDEPTREWPAWSDPEYFGATGEFGALNAEGVYAPGHLAIFVQRDL